MTPAPGLPRPRAAAPVLALIVNAAVWGVSWWPFRRLQALGLHPLWATTVVYLLSALAIGLWRPGAWRQVATQPMLWLILLASGTTNAGFNWAVSVGDVVRVVLLFYLMPLWALLLARIVLKERLTRAAIARVALAMGGAALVLSQGDAAAGVLPARAPGGFPLPDALALLGGFAFAANNVMLRRAAALPEEGRALAMFLGGAVVAGGLAALLSGGGAGAAAGVHWPTPSMSWPLPAAALALAFLASNLCLQYGAARLSATVTAVVMPCEVLFAALTAVWWGGATLHASVLAGGALILSATLASVFERRG
ncbi:MAG TPA: DMT family transporter [Burkholderiaceae bacterium]